MPASTASPEPQGPQHMAGSALVLGSTHSWLCTLFDSQQDGRVWSYVGYCELTDLGVRRPAGDNAAGPDTACTDIVCGANEYVSSNTCVACPAGKVRPESSTGRTTVIAGSSARGVSTANWVRATADFTFLFSQKGHGSGALA